MKPQWQAHLKPPSRSIHTALAGQLWVLRRHSLMLRLHLGPSILQAAHKRLADARKASRQHLQGTFEWR